VSRFPQANKSFGQHFLSSQTVIQKITSPLPAGTEAIVEVGPGPAVLTPKLAAHGKPVFVIEMDERFVELLSPVVGATNVFRQDALEFNWPQFLSGHDFASIWLVSNLPYNVSVPLTLSFLRIPAIRHMTLMYQKEVAEKILPREARNSMGSLLSLCASQFEVRHVVHAPPGAFVPPPKVDSQVLHFARRERPLVALEEIDAFEAFLRTVFAQRRKQLGGILRASWGAARADATLASANVGPSIRAEALTLQDVLNLFRAYSQDPA
jgi:16S rRNA (adenine1518-N6/adenine1519-N6)-dimethyltransferase